MGWTSVRHSVEEKWPLILEETIEEVQPSSPLSPSASCSSEFVRSTVSTRKPPLTPDCKLNVALASLFRNMFIAQTITLSLVKLQ